MVSAGDPWHEYFYALALQLLRLVSEKMRHISVGKNDATGLIAHDHRVRHRREKARRIFCKSRHAFSINGGRHQTAPVATL